MREKKSMLINDLKIKKIQLKHLTLFAAKTALKSRKLFYNGAVREESFAKIFCIIININ